MTHTKPTRPRGRHREPSSPRRELLRGTCAPSSSTCAEFFRPQEMNRLLKKRPGGNRRMSLVENALPPFTFVVTHQ